MVINTQLALPDPQSAMGATCSRWGRVGRFCTGVEPMKTEQCECADPGCPECHSHCERSATLVLYRVDMVDKAGTAMCEPCGTDAIDSGLFGENPTE